MSYVRNMLEKSSQNTYQAQLNELNEKKNRSLRTLHNVRSPNEH